MTNVILAMFAAVLAAIASTMVLWFGQDAPASVTAAAQRVATLEARNVAQLEEYGFVDGIDNRTILK